LVLGLALSQAFTWLNAKRTRKDHQADLGQAKRQGMSDLEREVGVKLLVALDHAIVVKGSKDVTGDTDVIRASSEELQIVGQPDVKLAAAVISTGWSVLAYQLETTGVADEGIVDTLIAQRNELREALRNSYWDPNEYHSGKPPG
jgi:hypothetical protein